MKLFFSILIMIVATQITRWFPFILFRNRKAPDWLLRGAKFIPGTVMMVLVITNIPLEYSGSVDLLPWVSVICVIALHLLFKHPLISIFGGTGIYMILLKLFT